MQIASVGRAFPPHYYDQETILGALRAHLPRKAAALTRLDGFHKNVQVGGRHLALSIPEYPELRTFGDTNAAWLRVALDVGEAAIRDALEGSGLVPADVGAIFFTSVTGIATPSLDARLVNRLGLPERIRRVPLFGLGCVAGAAGIARAADYVRAYPDQVALLLAVELCSLTLQREDLSVANLIASGLFGDGAAAVVVTGRERPAAAGPRVLDTRSVFYRDSEQVMGWTITERGFGVVLSAEVPEMVHRHLGEDVTSFLADHGLKTTDIATWICHPGGPKVLEAMEQALDLHDGQLDLTWESLSRVGNLSSVSVLLVLRDTMERARPEPGRYGVLLAMGPGFCSELVLLEW